MTEPRGLERLTRACATVRTRVAVATVALVVAGGATAILFLSLLPETVREGRGSTGPLAIATAWLLVAAAAGALVHRIRRRLDPLGLAAETDGAAGLGAGDVRGALEVARARGSGDLAALHRERVSRTLEGLDADGLLPLTGPRWKRRVRGATAIGAVTLLALAGSALLRPEPTWSAASALGAPWRMAFPVALPPLALEREAPVRRGERLGIRIVAPGRDRVVLAWRTAGESARRVDLEVAADGTASGRTGPITTVTRVWAEDLDGASPDTLTIRPVEPLLVQDLRVEVEYPDYLRRPRDEYRGQIPPLVAPEGTRLVIHGETNLPLDAGTLSWGPPDGASGEGEVPAPLALDVDRTRFSATLVPRRSGAWAWTLAASEALGEPVLPDPIRVLVVPDLPPAIQLLFPTPDTLLGPDGVMPLVVEVGDDIGLVDVVLRSWRSGLGEDRQERREVLEPRPEGSRRAVFRYVLDRSDAELLPGDTIFYRFEGFDGHPTRGPALSEVFLLRVPTFTELREDRARRTDELSESARELEDAVDALAEAAEDAARRAASEPEEGGFETTEEARSVLEEAERTAGDLENLEDELAAFRDELARSELEDQALEAELERLAERYEELRDAGLLDRIEELADALRELDPEAVRQALERLSEDSDWLREQLEQTLGLLEQAALDQAVKSAQANAEDLADRQRELAEGETRDPEEWSTEQESLAERADALSEALDDLEARLDEAGRQPASDSAGQAGERTAEAAGEMRRAASDTRRASSSDADMEGPTESSRSAAREAQSAMEEAAEALGSARQGMQQDEGRATSEALGRARAEALSLADEEGQLADATSGSDAQDPDTWRARQGAVRQGLDNLLERLADSGSEASMLDRETSAAAGDAAGRMDELLERLAEDGARRLPSRAEAEGIQESLNQLAVRLLGAEQAARAGEQRRQGGQQAGEQMQSLARQQQGVTQQTSSLLTPGPRPPGEERRSRELSSRQQEIADRLEDLEDPEGELLGRPEDMAAEARELARQLAESGPTQETLERQRRLFRRMLDAGRSLEDEDLDPNRRESETGRAIPREVPEIDPELLRGRRFPLPPEALLRELPVFYRPLIFRYFDRLNRPPESPPSGSDAPGSGDDGRP